MYYLLAYHHTHGDILALNQKGQLIGSEDLNEVITMLPGYNDYNSQEIDRRKAAPVWQFVFLTYIVQYESLKSAFSCIKSKKKAMVNNKTIYFASIHPECQSLLKKVPVLQELSEKE